MLEAIIPTLTLVVGADASRQRSIEDVPFVDRKQRRVAAETKRRSTRLPLHRMQRSADVGGVEVVDEVRQLLLITTDRRRRFMTS